MGKKARHHCPNCHAPTRWGRFSFTPHSCHQCQSPLNISVSWWTRLLVPGLWWILIMIAMFICAAFNNLTLIALVVIPLSLVGRVFLQMVINRFWGKPTTAGKPKWVLRIVKPVAEFFLLVLLIILFGYFRHNVVIVECGETCIKCLQAASGEKHYLFFNGLKFYQTRKLHQWDEDLYGLVLNHSGAMLVEDPAIYKEIFGTSCAHDFKIGRKATFFAHGHGDGYDMEGMVFLPRIVSLQALFRLYKKIPNKSLAKRTYQIIDKLEPVDTPVNLETANNLDNIPAFQELGKLIERLKTVTNEAEWEKGLEAFSSHL